MSLTPNVRKKTPEPWQPTPYDDTVMANIKALAADPQYKTAFDWIMFDLCRLGDLSFRTGPDGARMTDFAEGKRYVALQIAKMLKLRPNKPKEQP